MCISAFSPQGFSVSSNFKNIHCHIVFILDMKQKNKNKIKIVYEEVEEIQFSPREVKSSDIVIEEPRMRYRKKKYVN